jgi:uncharacterized RDD family membrane protein YckC
VYFRREDYASFWLRVLVDLIDFAVIGTAWAGLIVLSAVIDDSFTKTTFDLLLLALAAMAILYFVVLKRSRFRTLGYRVGRVRIVGLNGDTPSYFALLMRLMFATLGPFNWFLDLVWLSNDAHRQALRDKFANTYVIKAKAQPAGWGRIILRRYEILVINVLFREVVVEAQEDSEVDLSTRGSRNPNASATAISPPSPRNDS